MIGRKVAKSRPQEVEQPRLQVVSQSDMDSVGAVTAQVSISVRQLTNWLYIAGLVFIVLSSFTMQRALSTKIESLMGILSAAGADRIAIYDMGGLAKFSQHVLRDSDVVQVLFLDGKGNVFVQAGEAKWWHGTRHGVVRADNGSEIGKIQVSYSVHEVVIWAFIYILAGILGSWLYRRSIRQSFQSVLSVIITPTRVMVKRLSEASQQILNKSDHLVENSQSLFQEVASQSSATSESMSAMRQMQEMVAKTADYSLASFQKVTDVERKTQHVEEVVRKMTASIQSIEDATSELKEIYNIVGGIATKAGLINEIVFQTKLLSFNASVEAARAGEHGHGFAVVAQEIGHLAVMSGRAAKEINDLLGQSRSHVDRIVESTTNRIANVRDSSSESIEVFQEIAREIRDVAAKVQEIDQAAREQNQGVANSTKAMERIEEISRRSNDIAEGVRQAAHAMSQQSHQIGDVISELRKMV